MFLLTYRVNPKTRVLDPNVTMNDGTRRTFTKKALNRPTPMATANARRIPT